MQIGDLLLNVRKGKNGLARKKLSLMELSDISGISYGQIARIEKNQSSPRILTLVRICNGLGLTLQEVMAYLFPGRKLDQKWIAPRNYQYLLNLKPANFQKLLDAREQQQKLEAIGWSQHLNTDVYFKEDTDSYDQLAKLIELEFNNGSYMILPDLRAYLFAMRKDRKLSQWDLGKLLGIEYRGIQNLENGESHLLEWDLLNKIDEALDLRGAALGLAWAIADFEIGTFVDQVYKMNPSKVWIAENFDFFRKFILSTRYSALAELVP